MDQGYELAEAKAFAQEEPTATVRQVGGRAVVTQGCGMDDAQLGRHLASMIEAATAAPMDQLLAA